MGQRLDLRRKVEVEETGATFASVVCEKKGGIGRGTLARLSPHPDPEKRLDELARERVGTRDMDVDRAGDGEYTYNDLAPAWYEAHSVSGRLTGQRVFFRVDGESITDVVRPADYDRDCLIAAVLGVGPEELATLRDDLDAELRLRDADAGLEPLHGTPRQVRYAERVRREKIAVARFLTIESYEVLGRMLGHSLEVRNERQRRQAALCEWQDLAVNELRCIREATWWIDRKRSSGGEILAEVVGSLRAGQGVARG